jgi:RNA polymerase sigma-70 factor (ECF subfamily)
VTLAAIGPIVLQAWTSDATAPPPHPPAVESGAREEIDLVTLTACGAGDAGAIRRFVERYEDLVFAFLSRSTGRGPHVEDLAQEVFLRACRALPSFDPRGKAKASTWLLAIANRLVIDARRRRTLPTTELDPALDAHAAGTPETEHRRRQLGIALETAAAALPADQRDAFVLADLHGLDTRDVAAILGVREATARTRLFRARARLRELLAAEWGAR